MDKMMGRVSWFGSGGAGLHAERLPIVKVETKDPDRRARSFSDGSAIMKYTNEEDLHKPSQDCSHGIPRESCTSCKHLNGVVANGNSPQDTSGHCHQNGEIPIDRNARKRLIIASVLCLIFMVGEIVGGYLANSLAIMTDAAHLLTDFASFMISLFALWVATRKASKNMNFGWYRAEVIGALTSVLLIWVVTGVLVFLAVDRIINKTYEIEATVMLITSGVGVLVNIIMGATLHTHGHSHGGGSSHGHSHGSGGGASADHAAVEEGHAHGADGHSHEVVGHGHKQSAQTNINVRAAFIHVIGDFFQSLGVFTAALIIFFKPTWGIVDPICTFLFSILVLFTTFAIMKDTLRVLMEGIPKGVDFNDVYDTVKNIEGVAQVHNLRIWSLSMDKIALSAHVVVDAGVIPGDVLKRASQLVRDKYSFFEMTLQIEELVEEMKTCKDCQEFN